MCLHFYMTLVEVDQRSPKSIDGVTYSFQVEFVLKIGDTENCSSWK